MIFDMLVSLFIILLFVAGSIGLIIVACDDEDDFPSEQEQEEMIKELKRLHEMFSHVLNETENKKEDDF